MQPVRVSKRIASLPAVKYDERMVDERLNTLIESSKKKRAFQSGQYGNGIILTSCRLTSPAPNEFFRYVEVLERTVNYQHIRVHVDSPVFDLFLCGPQACESCIAFRTAVAKTLPATWVVYVRRSTEGTVCPAMVYRASGAVIPMRCKSKDVRTMCNALSHTFKAKRIFSPMKHQKDLAVKFENDPTLSTLLLWSMGSGKTAGAAYAVRQNPKVTVVCENTLIDLWADTFSGSMGIRPKVAVWDVRICGYQKLQADIAVQPRMLKNRAVIIDEVQHYKNFHQQVRLGGGMAQVVATVEHDACALLLLSGTPLLNGCLDMVYLLALLAPDSDVTKAFKNVASTVSGMGRDLTTNYMENVAQCLGTDVVGVYRALQVGLQGKVHFFSPERFQSKTFSKHYPILNELKPTEVELSWPQTLQYFWTTDGFDIEVNGLHIHSSAARGGELRQLAVVSSTDLVGEYFSSKTDVIIKTLAQRVKDANGAPVQQVVFSGLRERSLLPVMKQLQQQFPEWRLELLDGQVKGGVGARQAILDRFVQGKIDVLLICRVGSVGLNLHGTSVMHMMEPQCNVMTEQQVFNRTRRFSKTPPQPTIVDAVRYIGTFPNVDCPGPVGRERSTIRTWLSQCRPDIIEAFSRAGHSDGVDNVEHWLRQRISDRGVTMDQRRYANNQKKYVEIEPLISLLECVSDYVKASTKDTARLEKLIVTGG